MDEYQGPRKGLSPVKVYTENGDTYRIKGRVGWSEIGGQSPYFSVTVEVHRKTRNNRWMDEGGGAAHDLFAEHFPKLAHLVRWHLVSYDKGPMHYPANPLYLASDRDHWGRRKGEPSSWRTFALIGNSPLSQPIHIRRAQAIERWQREHFSDEAGTIRRTGGELYLTLVPVSHERDGHHYGEKFYIEEIDGELPWHDCPYGSRREAEEWSRALLGKVGVRFSTEAVEWSEGKAPELEAARRSACWPDATLEQLQDEAALMARLPDLLAQMRAEVEAAGIDWPTVWLSDASN